jgi:DNA-binding NarL/FixJ family response regulator
MVVMERLTHSLMLVDDHPIIHSALKALLETEESLSIEATAISAVNAMEVLETMDPDLIIIDLSLGDSDGTYLIQKIHNQHPKMRILVYTMSEERLYGERVASAGARGYVMKTSRPSILKKAIYEVLDGELFFSIESRARLLKRQAGRPVAPQSALDNLSNREIDIFRLIGEGLNSLHIGDRLNISKNTVDTHRINIRNKLELPNGKALDRMAYGVSLHGKPPDS